MTSFKPFSRAPQSAPSAPDKANISKRGLLHLYIAELLLRRRALLADARVTKDGHPHNDFHFAEHQAVNAIGIKYFGDEYKDQVHKVSLRTYDRVAALMLKKDDMEGEVELGIWAVMELAKAVVFLQESGERKVVEKMMKIGKQLCPDGGFEDTLSHTEEEMKRMNEKGIKV